ncbi:hypothetical protein HZA40_02925 [Candidatus Peregrinibacteria bacterium]|nr:hypothetical protein [Candidatus Peregrinibacteria bacterium]
MNFEKAKEFLKKFVSYEGVAKIPYSDAVFDLQRVKDFLQIYGVEYEKLKCIHVAGSKGKGSTCAFIANYLWRDGYKVGLYTSPHLFDVTERFWLNGKDIPKNEFAKYVEDLKNFIEKNDCPELTYFEILTVIALKYFVDNGVDYAVLEVGLGGRLDATNVPRPVLSILTMVELEHTDVLGNTIEKILYEKLGIVKNGAPILIGFQNGEAIKVIGKRLKNKEDVFYVKDFKFKFSEKNFLDEARFENVHVAFSALKILLKRVNEKKFLKIAMQLKLPGRIDVRKMLGKTVVFDVAHTEKSISNLADALKKNFGKNKFIFLFALMKGKNVQNILRKISHLAEKIVFTDAHEARGIAAVELQKISHDLNLPCEIVVVRNPKIAFKNFLKSLKKNQLLVVTGSHFLVGKLLKN